MADDIYELQTKHLLEESVKSLGEFVMVAKERELYGFVVEAVEKGLIEMVLDKTGGNRLEAARILGINRNTLHAKIKKLGIHVPLIQRQSNHR
jgi:DNA-binding protein Fis